MNWWKKFIHRPNCAREIEDMKGRLSESAEKQGLSARKLSKAAETVGRTREEERKAKEIQCFRAKGAM